MQLNKIKTISDKLYTIVEKFIIYKKIKCREENLHWAWKQIYRIKQQ